MIQYAGLVLVIAVFGLLTQGRILNSFNMKMVIKQLVVLFILCIGLSAVYAHGGFDISVGAVIALCAMAATFAMNVTQSVFAGFIVAIAIAVGLYLINIVVAIQFGVMSTISSLAIMFIARGIVQFIAYTKSENINVNIDASFYYSNTGFMVFLMIVVAVIGILLFNYTGFGKQNRAIGDNPLAAAQSGVKVNRVKMLAYAFAGFCTGIAALMYTVREGTITDKAGSGMEMSVIIALILGGMALNGGSKAKISAAIIGSITFVFLNNGLTMAGVSTNAVFFVKGTIFLAIIFLTLRKQGDQKALPR